MVRGWLPNLPAAAALVSGSCPAAAALSAALRSFSFLTSCLTSASRAGSTGTNFCRGATRTKSATQQHVLALVRQHGGSGLGRSRSSRGSYSPPRPFSSRPYSPEGRGPDGRSTAPSASWTRCCRPLCTVAGPGCWGRPWCWPCGPACRRSSRLEAFWSLQTSGRVAFMEASN